jgi:ferredoxin
VTISIDEYYAKKQPARKKEPQYVAFINKNSCTSCNACATMCPVDCIYEVPGGPSDAFHVIDISRCIGCQMCYRVPSESTGPWTMEICPWNAIDLIHNPNVKEWESILAPYYVGENGEPDFRKLEEIGYNLYLNREIFAKEGSTLAEQIAPLVEPVWSYGEGTFAILRPPTAHEDDVKIYQCTDEGDELVDFLYREYEHMFLD